MRHREEREQLPLDHFYIIYMGIINFGYDKIFFDIMTIWAGKVVQYVEGIFFSLFDTGSISLCLYALKI